MPVLTNSKVTVLLLDSGVQRDSPAAEHVIAGINLSGEGSADDIFATSNDHGTRIAETILAECPDAKLITLRVIDDKGWLRTTEAIDHAFAWIDAHLDRDAPAVVCAAFGDMFHYRDDAPFADTSVLHTIRSLRSRGVLTVAAAGNLYPRFRHAAPQGMAWPAILRDVISVGALHDGEEGSSHRAITRFSQRLHSSAGTGCATTLFAASAPPGDTSGAAARVTGRLALLIRDAPLADADLLTQRLLDETHSIRDVMTGLTWPALLPLLS